MKTMKLYEPAMCCPTGLCGVGVDPELLRISTALNTLKQNGVEVGSRWPLFRKVVLPSFVASLVLLLSALLSSPAPAMLLLLCPCIYLNFE